MALADLAAVELNFGWVINLGQVHQEYAAPI